MNKLIKALIAAAILGGGGYFAYSQFQPKNEIAYITEPVKRGKISQTVSATGELSASQLVDVGAQVSGQIKKMHVKIGDVVQQGDLIAEIDNRSQINDLNTNRARLETFQAQLASAEIALKTALKKHSRYAELGKAGAVSKEEMEQTEDALASAKARIKELQSSIKQTQIAINTSETDLGYTRITAPINGTVVALVVEEGQTINANQTTPTVVQIANLSTMLNKMQIAEGDATKVQAGQNISFTILSEPDAPISATLDSIDPGLTTMSQGNYSKSTDTTSSAVYYYARATVPNDNGKLAIGMTTQNTIEIASASDVLVVPSIAIKNQQGKKIVRILGADQKPIEKEIQTGLRDSMNTEIQAGLNEGEQLIMSEMGAGEKAKQQNMPPMGGRPR
ncbi:efflux RND transporter periplasmic adaptor subunit [Alysiella filiformis]|uniref:Membrane fusion protein, macrolide-specific efflux system n=1 Tax=Alysiella filiformis DSM 16848 TaxID=1120981 RepID=A0A286EGB8_9NEIS|nr:efflux RND transporter periplasmic adaptor subunit [Alysiella filiformis]QMT31219.1 efflux RND transporter periplasmic adaptor subunit [Alysiella filiformis]UBQ55781.1 efflux RND transporter periplasmic adaptor subunit [Alysiella filiformis DSM 16848]SOD69869.1 membrane fusion protein, macrolide-specific efflux system [Alysiella filiformis DSM 16848]